MSGHEGGYTVNTNWMNQADLKEFATTSIGMGKSSVPGQSIADLLRGSQQLQGKSGTDYFTSSGQKIAPEVIAAYNKFVQDRQQAQTMRDEYVKAVQDTPGRAATLLVQPKGQEPKTLLSSPATNKVIP